MRGKGGGSAGLSKCLPLPSQPTGKYAIESFGVLKILLDHLHIANPKQANDTTLVHSVLLELLKPNLHGHLQHMRECKN